MRYGCTFRSFSSAAFAVVAAALASSNVHSAEPTLADLGFSDDMIRSIAAALNAPAASPARSFGSPIGFGAGWGSAFVGLAVNTLPDYAQDDVDGGAGVGIGLGNPVESVGADVSVNLISLSGRGRNFGEDGSFNAKLHRSLPMQAAVAVGVENFGRWGDAQDCSESSVYAVGTKVFDLPARAGGRSMPLTLNLGVGNERFNRIEGRDSGTANPGCPGALRAESGANVFGGVALAPFDTLSLIADWTGRDLNLGVSFVPFRRLPLALSAGVINVTERYEEFGGETIVVGSVGYSFTF